MKAPPVTGQLIRLNSRKRRFVPEPFNPEMMRVQFIDRHFGMRLLAQARNDDR
jgi:hypothetical protein